MQKIGAESYYYFADEYYNNLLFGQNRIINVYDNSTEELQATMILMIYGDYAHYHLSGRSSNCRNNAVNNFMLDEAIKFAQKRGCKLFHFGGGNSSKENDSLLKFKQNFSKDNGLFYIGKKVHNKKIYDRVIKQWEKKTNNIDNKRLLRYRENL
jgi:lipid II:glycine glycyltransferase (peptidoglycan interpeptide bridge formation enzyme)